MSMSQQEFENLIRAHREAIEGDACSRARIVDALLDMRLDAGSRTDLIDLFDLALADLPGKNLVPSEWWRQQLDMFELAAINPVEPVG